jgi:hypothetical protein
VNRLHTDEEKNPQQKRKFYIEGAVTKSEMSHEKQHNIWFEFEIAATLLLTCIPANPKEYHQRPKSILNFSK